MEIDPRLGQRLCARMRQQRVSVNSLADYLDVAPSTVSGWRRGVPMKVWQVTAICKILECSSDWLLWGEPFELSKDEYEMVRLYREMSDHEKQAFLQLFRQLAPRWG